VVAMRAGQRSAKGIGGTVLNPDVDRLFFILAAAFFALALVRTVSLLFS